MIDTSAGILFLFGVIGFFSSATLLFIVFWWLAEEAKDKQ